MKSLKDELRLDLIINEFKKSIEFQDKEAVNNTNIKIKNNHRANKIKEM